MTISSESIINGEQEDILERPSRSIVAIYDGHVYESRVNELFGWLHHSFKADLKLSFNSWAFGKLEVLDSRAMSVRTASAADVIIIAANDQCPLPDQMKRWLETVMREQRAARALLVGLDDNAGSSQKGSDSLCGFIQQEALRWRTDFICCHDFNETTQRQCLFAFIKDQMKSLEQADVSKTPSMDGSNEAAPNLLATQSIIRDVQSSMSLPEIQEVRELAYDLWLQAGLPPGRETEFWLSAEQQIKVKKGLIQ
jgi:Protein of unknown function (DUF2934)